MTTSDYQPSGQGPPPYRFVTPPAAPPTPLVTFAAEARLKHAATLWIVIGYVWVGLWALIFVLMLGGVAIL